MDGWIVIPRWDEFQHRDMARSTVPPWIKTYTKLMGDDDFRQLSFHLRGVLVSLWLEYAAARRQLRGSTAALTRRLGQRVTTRDLESLNHAGFIAFSASKPAGKVAGIPAGLEVEVENKELKILPSALKPEEPRPAPTTSVPASSSHRTNVVASDPVAAVERLIRNGVIHDQVDLESELNGYGIDPRLAEGLHDQLERRLASEAHP